MSNEDYKFKIEPGEGIIIHIDDKTGDCRFKEDLSRMMSRIREIVNEYNYDLEAYGNDKSYLEAEKLLRWWKDMPKFESE